jgi:hypothetical protein
VRTLEKADEMIGPLIVAPDAIAAREPDHM